MKEGGMVTMHDGPSHTQNKSSSITSNDVMTRSYGGACQP